MVRLDGIALHAGVAASVTLAAAPGPLSLVQRGITVPFAALRVGRADRGVRLVGPDGAPALDLCEHLLAAFAGLGIRDGVQVRTDDRELPLLDGGARAFAEALLRLEVSGGGLGALVVARPGRFELGASRYDVTVADGACLEVDVEFPAPVGRERARWEGDPTDFLRRLATARTFGWYSEHAALLAKGRSRGAAQQPGLLIFTDDGVLEGCRPAEPDECARHKLLDLLGDLMVHGGWGRGALHAHRPGHAATHAFVAEALREGVLVHRPSATRCPERDP